MADNSTQAETESWQPCPAGELQRMVADLRVRRRRRQSRRMLAVGGGLAVILLAVSLVWRQEPNAAVSHPVEMTCEQVRPLLPDFARGRISDQQLAQRIRTHLDKCPPCEAIYQRLLSVRQTAFPPEAHQQVDLDCGPGCPHHHAYQLAQSHRAAADPPGM